MRGLSILLLEENPHLCSLLAWHLQQLGHHVLTAADVVTAKGLLSHQSIHLVVLDTDFSTTAGLNFCTWIYQQFDLLILILSSQASESDIVAGLEAGADDYITKPLSMRMLSSRVQTLARRLHRSVPPTYLQYDDLRIDLVQRRVTVANQAIELTPQEFSLLFVLVQAQGSPLSRTELLERAWPEAIDNPRTVDTHILSLRKKIEADPRQPHLIQTIRNVGYCFGPGPSETETSAITLSSQPTPLKAANHTATPHKTTLATSKAVTSS